MENGIKSMRELFDRTAAMNGDYYDLRGRIVSKERYISALNERPGMWTQYQKKSVLCGGWHIPRSSRAKRRPD